MITIRNANQSDVEHIARLWHTGWHEAHAEIVPEQLTRLRTIESFVQRIKKHLPNTRIAVTDTMQGMCVIRGAELFQLYISPNARGSGLAKKLMDDAEQLLITKGNSLVWLVCAIGNERAAKFYQKCGWQLKSTIVDELETIDGVFPLEVWKFEKELID